VGEKALVWLRLRARGAAGHGSRFHPDNAVTRLAEAVAALGRSSWPLELTATTRQTVDGLAALCGADPPIRMPWRTRPDRHPASCAPRSARRPTRRVSSRATSTT
jgi:acetylornithine deacetylase/succinyl-diaminopimelate desuccinylase-like protein